MMKYYLVFFLFICKCASAQIYFNKTIDFSSETETAYSITQLENGDIVILGAYLDHEVRENYSIQSIFLMKLDEYGNQIWLQKYADSTAVLYTGFNGLIQTQDGGFAFGGGYAQAFPENLPAKYLIGKFDSLGNKDWFHTYGYEDYDTGLQAKQLADGGFVMTGVSQNFSETGEGLDAYDIYIIRTDKEGNLLWEKHIDNEGFDNSTSVQVLPNGNMLFGGFLDNSILGEYDGYILELDGEGNIVDEQVFGTEYTDCGMGIELLKDGNYLVHSCEGKLIDGEIVTIDYIAKIDTNYNILWKWESKYSIEEYNLIKAVELKDGSIGFAGWYDRNSTSTLGWMGRLSSEGELIWEKEYYTVRTKHQNFYDMVAANDGGMIAVGQAFNPDDVENDESFNIWVVKVNCMGEFEALAEGESCDVIVGIENEPLLQQNSLHIFPNPTQDQVQFSWNTPATQLSVYNTTGQLITQIPLDLGQKILQLEVVDWRSGVYLVVLEDETGAIWGREKMVVR
ncbi:MAG: T9SS type A sorting domain-containing protein [Chitinophagales bacterium]